MTEPRVTIYNYGHRYSRDIWARVVSHAGGLCIWASSERGGAHGMGNVKPPSYFALNLQNKISLLELAKFEIIPLLDISLRVRKH